MTMNDAVKCTEFQVSSACSSVGKICSSSKRLSHIHNPKTCMQQNLQANFWTFLRVSIFCPSQDTGPSPGKNIQGVV